MSDGFLSRWARRKRDVRLGERADVPPVAAEATEDTVIQADETPVPDAATAEAEREVLDALPRLEDLTAETDLTPFLRAGVPSALRNAALRRMWSVDPAIRDFVSEAREYAYDWNTPGGVPGLGPLLPGDDVKAMLGRLFNRDPAEAVESGPTAIGSAATEMETGLPEPAARAESERGSSPSNVLGPADMPGPSDLAHDPQLPSDSLSRPDPVNSPERAPVTTIDNVAKSRLRRHGGAMPS